MIKMPSLSPSLSSFLPAFPPYMSLPERAWFFVSRSLNVLILVFLILPILVMIPLSFSDSSFLMYPIKGFSLRWYQNLFASDDWMRAARNSFIVAPTVGINPLDPLWIATLVAIVTLSSAELPVRRC